MFIYTCIQEIGIINFNKCLEGLVNDGWKPSGDLKIIKLQQEVDTQELIFIQMFYKLNN